MIYTYLKQSRFQKTAFIFILKIEMLKQTLNRLPSMNRFILNLLKCDRTTAEKCNRAF